MNDDRRVVYSTEQGSLAKPMAGGKKRKARQSAQTPTIKNPAKQGVRIRRESKGRGGKNVCVIDGLQLADGELKALLKRLKGKLGTGGAVKAGYIEVQGDHRDKLLELLAQEGIKAKLAGG